MLISSWTVQADQRVLLYSSFSTPTPHVKHVCCVALKMSSQSKESSSTVSAADHSMGILGDRSFESHEARAYVQV